MSLTFPDVIDDAALFSQTVPRHYVHKRTVSEVLLTHWRPLRDGSFLVAAQWPRGHGLYGPANGVWHDPMLIVETVRQAGLLLSHTEFGVPIGHQFIMKEVSYTVDPDGLVIEDHPAELCFRFARDEIRRRYGTAAGMRLTAELFRDSLRIGSADVAFRCISPAVYARLRPLRRVEDTLLAPPVVPSLVGRDSTRDVAIAAGPRQGVWTLRADPEHPVLFDHSVDHVPGMVIMEGLRQAALHALHPAVVLPTAVRATFSRYVERDMPCLIRTVRAQADRPDDRVVVTATAEQNGETAAECLITVMPQR